MRVVMPHGTSGASTSAATSSPISAAPGRRMMYGTSVPPIIQKPTDQALNGSGMNFRSSVIHDQAMNSMRIAPDGPNPANGRHDDGYREERSNHKRHNFLLVGLSDDL